MLEPGFRLSHIYIYICIRVSWKINWLTKILSWNATKWGSFFSINHFAVKPLLSLMLQCLDPIGKKPTAVDTTSTYKFFSPPIYIYLYIYWHVSYIYIYIYIWWLYIYIYIYIWWLYIYIYIYIYIPDIGMMLTMFANGPGNLVSIPGQVIPKTQKMVLHAALLNTQHYKVQIKGKVEQSRERSNAPQTHLGVVTIEKGAFWSSSTKVADFTYIYIYIWGSLNKFPDFFRMGTFIDSTHMKL